MFEPAGQLISLNPFTVLGIHAALSAVMDTGVLKLIQQQPRSAAECARLGNVDRAAIEQILALLASGGLLNRQGAYYTMPADPEIATLLASPMLFHLQEIFAHTQDWLRSGKPLSFMDTSSQQREVSYGRMVDAIGDLEMSVATSLAMRIAGHPTRILDVGCGSGVWSLLIAAQHPQAEVTGLDFPTILDVFAARAQQLGLAARACRLPGDMHVLELPEDAYDLVILANVLRLESEERAQRLVTRVSRALRRGGRLLVIDAMAVDTPAKQLLRNIYALSLYLRTAVGQIYSQEQVRKWMHAAGVTNVQTIDFGAHVMALEALLGERT